MADLVRFAILHGFKSQGGFPAEVMADLAQMIAADRPEPEAAFARMSTDAVKHRDPFGPAGSCRRVFLCTFRDC